MANSEDIINAEYYEIDDTGRPYDAIVPYRVMIPFDDTIPDPRIPCILLVDTSYSMSGDRIAQVNRMIASLRQALQADDLSSQRVELAVVSFSDQAKVVQDFALAHDCNASQLTAEGSTAMGAAIETALDLLEARKQVYRDSGRDYYRPWLVLLTDGAATDRERMTTAIPRIRNYQERKKVVFIPLGIGEDPTMFKTLKELSDYSLPFDESKWDELLRYLVQNFKSVSESAPVDMVGPSNPSTLIDKRILKFMTQ